MADTTGTLRPTASPAGTFESILATGAVAALIIVGMWYILSALALLYAKRTRNRSIKSAVARWGAPIIKTLAATSLATSLATPAFAAGEPIDLSWGADVPASVAESEPSGYLPADPDNLWLPRHAASRADLQPKTTGSAASLSPQTSVEGSAPFATSAETSALSTASAHTDPDAGRQPLQSTYTVKPGDNLWSIVRSHYSPTTDSEAANLVLDLWQANASTITDPNVIYPGQALQLP